MAINPIVFTDKVVGNFLRYQLTTYPFADTGLHRQMRDLLSLEKTRESPLLKGPFLSLSRAFRLGAKVDELVRDHVLHPLMRERIPREIQHVWGHQEQAIRAIRAGKTTLVSTGTGSGKSECFLYPIISRCLELVDEKASQGIVAVLVYPMNALAEDQLLRLRGLLAGTGIRFGMYVGKTPESEADVANHRLPPGSSRSDYEAALKRAQAERRGQTVSPNEEVCSREAMRTPGAQPRILLTNVKQLELLLTRQKDVELFDGARLEFLVFDEAHTFTGAQGAEAACLVRRLRRFCGRSAKDMVCVATSATIVDQGNPNAARDFASRFFGVDAAGVVTVGEAYEAEVWKSPRWTPHAPDGPADALAGCAKAVDGPAEAVRMAFRQLAGRDLGMGDWSAELNAALSSCELVVQLAQVLERPAKLQDASAELGKRLGRKVSDEEVLAWMTLGAAARNGGRPLLRPVVHGFIRGIPGAVVSFPAGDDGPRLWLAAEDEIASSGGEGHARFPLTTCTTCGQHYYLTFLKDFVFTGKEPEGGSASGSTRYWEPLEESSGGKRLVLIDHLVGSEEDDDGGLPEERITPLWFCRSCGTAHAEKQGRCLHCGKAQPMVELATVRSKEENPGWLPSCLSCGATGKRFGSRYREPARPVRATNVADVHVLAQEMVHHAERPRLLVFCDNRQDAAFQAGWMRDHARRFRLRTLMAEALVGGALSVGDLALALDERLDKDDSLSRALIPEVWQFARKEGSGGRHEKERRKFLRILVMREITLSPRQNLGLEPWGRLKVEYEGLGTGDPFIVALARRLGLSAAEMREGIASLLDYLRRQRVLSDPELGIFSKFWGDGDYEIQNGYLPQIGAPKGTKLELEPDDDASYVLRWISSRGDSVPRQVVKKWGVAAEHAEDVLREVFGYLKDSGLLVPVTLRGFRGKALPKTKNLYQVAADRLRLVPTHGFWTCDSCRRRTARPTPRDRCTAWRCSGALGFTKEDPENYDLHVLDHTYAMLRPEEHTAMVPHEDREFFENLFKGESDALNCLVCTQTLELGVDIGALDAILMRNVPPLPANYWQRAGRAGRRHRMAVNFTYCRSVSHDRAYFVEPEKMLLGQVDPPAFNLSNDLMVAKHVHAAVITRLQQLARDSRVSAAERDSVRRALDQAFPSTITSYLFEGNMVRVEPFDLAPLRTTLASLRAELLSYASEVFADGWPASDKGVVSAEALERHVMGMADELGMVVARLRRRLQWAMAQIARLEEKRRRAAVLEPEDESIFRRCDSLLKRMKGMTRRARREAEGHDDVATFGVLAAEGFLPGYGLETGSILGTAEVPSWRSGAKEFVLPRPPSVALREYVPGNVIFANGHQFVARRFHREADEEKSSLTNYEVATDRKAVLELGASSGSSGFGGSVLPTIAVCDCDLIHRSQISDEEENRFQLGVAVYGVERDQHDGGTAFLWGDQELHHRRGVRFRLVNIGVRGEIERRQLLGYPVCTVCGQSVSPLSSDRQKQEFEKDHQERCRRKPVAVGFHADIVADAITLQACADQTTAYTLLEALRMAVAEVLDMSLDDLQVLVIGHVDRDDVDGHLWDPMPGGSGLLDRIIARFPEVTLVAQRILSQCASACTRSCIDCLQTYRNAFYHEHLDRSVGVERLRSLGERLARRHDIPALHPASTPEGSKGPSNGAEVKLRHLLIAAGFGEGRWQETLGLGPGLPTTTPDVVYRAPNHAPEEGVLIYLDGLSGSAHGDPGKAQRDREVRAWARDKGYEVIEIYANHLDDPEKMTQHFRRLAGYLDNPELRERLRSDRSWFTAPVGETAEATAPKLRLVQPTNDQKYKTCVPLVPLKAAAGTFSDPQHIEDDGFEWVALDSRHRLRPGMFVAQVVGRSMEPTIPDGGFCLFRSPVEGTRQGKTVLVELRALADPETGQRYTVKVFESEKMADGDSWKHATVALKPINPAFEPIVLTSGDDAELVVVAELVEVLRLEP